MLPLIVIVGAFVALIFLVTGSQTCQYHPDLAGTPGYQECHFAIRENWIYLLACVVVIVGVTIYYITSRARRRTDSMRSRDMS